MAECRLPQTGNQGRSLKRQLKDTLIEHRQDIGIHGEDMPDIRNWQWQPTTQTGRASA